MMGKYKYLENDVFITFVVIGALLSLFCLEWYAVFTFSKHASEDKDQHTSGKTRHVTVLLDATLAFLVYYVLCTQIWYLYVWIWPKLQNYRKFEMP